MKCKLLVLSFGFFTGAQAAYVEWECPLKSYDGKSILLEVLKHVPNAANREVRFTVTGEDGVDVYDYFTRVDRRQFGKRIYNGPGVDLEIDLWPDNSQPRFGKKYRANLDSWAVGEYRNFECKYKDQ